MVQPGRDASGEPGARSGDSPPARLRRGGARGREVRARQRPRAAQRVAQARGAAVRHLRESRGEAHAVLQAPRRGQAAIRRPDERGGAQPRRRRRRGSAIRGSRRRRRDRRGDWRRDRRGGRRGATPTETRGFTRRARRSAQGRRRRRASRVSESRGRSESRGALARNPRKPAGGLAAMLQSRAAAPAQPAAAKPPPATNDASANGDASAANEDRVRLFMRRARSELPATAHEDLVASLRSFRAGGGVDVAGLLRRATRCLRADEDSGPNSLYAAFSALVPEAHRHIHDRHLSALRERRERRRKRRGFLGAGRGFGGRTRETRRRDRAVERGRRWERRRGPARVAAAAARSGRRRGCCACGQPASAMRVLRQRGAGSVRGGVRAPRVLLVLARAARAGRERERAVSVVSQARAEAPAAEDVLHVGEAGASVLRNAFFARVPRTEDVPSGGCCQCVASCSGKLSAFEHV